MVARLPYAAEKLTIVMYILSVELNLSATESALTIVSHYRPFPSHDPKALRVCLIQNLRNGIDHPLTLMQGSGVVRLFHREKECYVSAEGSFAENPVVVEDGK